jgi:hypothetical protein
VVTLAHWRLWVHTLVCCCPQQCHSTIRALLDLLLCLLLHLGLYLLPPRLQEIAYPEGASHLELHPLQASVAQGEGDPRAAGATADDKARVLRVPGRTTAVFVAPRS